MKWWLVKILCIAGLLGALPSGDPAAGLVIAPFGWFAGKIAELRAEAKTVGVSDEVMEVQEGREVMSKNRDEDDFLQEMWKEEDELITDPTYSGLYYNIFHENQFGPPW